MHLEYDTPRNVPISSEAYHGVDEIGFGCFAAMITTRGQSWRWAARASDKRT
jgi:hypothetical protein